MKKFKKLKGMVEVEDPLQLGGGGGGGGAGLLPSVFNGASSLFPREI